MRCQWLKAMAYPYDGVSFHIDTLPPTCNMHLANTKIAEHQHIYKLLPMFWLCLLTWFCVWIWTATYIKAFAKVLITHAYLVLCLNINPAAISRILWKNPVGCWSITIFITLNHSLNYNLHSTRMQTTKLRTYIQHVFANLVIRYQPKSCLKKKFCWVLKKSLLTSSLHKSFYYTMHFTHTQTAKHNIIFLIIPPYLALSLNINPRAVWRLSWKKRTGCCRIDPQLMLVAGATE